MAQGLIDVLTFLESNSVYIYALVGIIIFFLGILLMIPSKTTREIALKAAPWLAVGSGLVIGAVTIATEITGMFTF